MEGCGKFIKYAVFIVNFVIFLGGLTICGIGIYALATKYKVENLLETDMYNATAAILVSTGGIIAIISFLGCCGALKEVKCLLLTFFIILMIIFVILLVGAIMGFVFKDKVEDLVTEGLRDTLKKYADDNEVIKNAWDQTQKDLMCCGIQIYTNWTLNPKYASGGVPESCCKDMKKEDCTSAPTEENAYLNGCYNKVLDIIKKHAAPLAGVAIAIALILILGMVFSCALFLMI